MQHRITVRLQQIVIIQEWSSYLFQIEDLRM
jgi:hypothetical protein